MNTTPASRNDGLTDRQLENALSRLLNGEPNTHDQTKAIVDLALQALKSSASEIGWMPMENIGERQVAWIDRDARHVAMVVNGQEYILNLPPLPKATK